MAHKLETGVLPNVSFKINGLNYSRGEYEIIYRDEDSAEPRIGLRKTSDNSILVNPSVYGDWSDSLNVPYSSVDALTLAILDLVYNSNGDKLDAIISNTGGDGTTSIVVNKFGENLDINGAEELIASFGGAFDPSTAVMSSAQTFTITYNNTTDGSGQAGVQALQISYIDENFEAQTGFHFMGATGSDVTSFTGVGINRVVAIQYGANSVAGDNITLTATVDATNQAQILAGASTTLQAIYHTPINKVLDINYININAIKILGGGSPPVINVQLKSYSRITRGVYSVMSIDVDTGIKNNLELNLVNPIIFTGREVIYMTCSTDQVNTKVFARFSGTERNT